MKKGIIIIGPEESGKTVLAKGFMSEMKYPEVIFMDGKQLNMDSNFPFNATTPETKLIVIDDLKYEDAKHLPVMLDLGIRVEPVARLPFVIKPDIIASMQSSVTFEDIDHLVYINGQFTIYELKKHEKK